MCTTIRNLIRMKYESDESSGRAYVDQLCLEGLVSMASMIEGEAAASGSLESIYAQLAVMMSEIACHCYGISDQLVVCYRALLNQAHAAVGPATAHFAITDAIARNIHQSLPRDSSIMANSSIETLVILAAAMIDATPVGLPSADIRRAVEKVRGTAKKIDTLELYRMTNTLLGRAYEQLSGHAGLVKPLTRLVKATTDLLIRQSTFLASDHMKVLQHGIASLVLDKRGSVFLGDSNSVCAKVVSKLRVDRIVMLTSCR
jgi:hypothetical protein